MLCSVPLKLWKISSKEEKLSSSKETKSVLFNRGLVHSPFHCINQIRDYFRLKQKHCLIKLLHRQTKLKLGKMFLCNTTESRQSTKDERAHYSVPVPWLEQ